MEPFAISPPPQKINVSLQYFFLTQSFLFDDFVDSLSFPLIYFLFHARHFSPSVIENNSPSPSLLFCQRDLKGFKSMPFREVLEGGRKPGWESRNWPQILLLFFLFKNKP